MYWVTTLSDKMQLSQGSDRLGRDHLLLKCAVIKRSERVGRDKNGVCAVLKNASKKLCCFLLAISERWWFHQEKQLEVAVCDEERRPLLRLCVLQL